MYIDIDVHHGDGVEEAFYTTNRVLTMSFHRFGRRFFPRTGSIDEYGEQDGKYYSINVPLKSGIIDEQYINLFKTLTDSAYQRYRPSAVVIQ